MRSNYRNEESKNEAVFKAPPKSKPPSNKIESKLKTTKVSRNMQVKISALTPVEEQPQKAGEGVYF